MSSLPPANVLITELILDNIVYGSPTKTKTGMGPYVALNYIYGGPYGKKPLPLAIKFPPMFSWGAKRDDRELNQSKEKYNIGLQFPRASDLAQQTPAIKACFEKLLALENKIKADGVANAEIWGMLDEAGQPITEIKLGHQKSAGAALLKWPLDKSNPKVKKLLKNDPERQPSIQLKLQQANGRFQCSVFNEDEKQKKIKMIYCPQNKAGTIPPEICNLTTEEFLELIPMYSTVESVASLTLWLDNPWVTPSLTVQQVLCYKPTQRQADPSDCMFSTPLSEEDKHRANMAAVTIVDDNDNGFSAHAASSNALQIVDESDDEADVVMPAPAAVKKPAGVVVPAKAPPAAAPTDDSEDDISDEEAAPVVAKPAPAAAAKPAAGKKVVVKKAAAK